ncbi:helix-turn-helix transcriptional regulator [Streptomyces sp. NPDC047097]|uniref:helix-turn-helix domain-containing protein n=1 Tax=Streptomyces sp. NPDC047097 TaxID=3155260 RepID=UPI0033E48AB1
MTGDRPPHVGQRVAYFRGIARPRLTQTELAERAGVALGTVRKIERGERRSPSTAVLEALADALGVDVPRLLGEHTVIDPVRDALPSVSAAIATYDVPDDGPVRPLDELATLVDACVQWRVGAQYLRIARTVPALLPELARAVHTGPDPRRAAGLLVAAYRSADAAAYKYGSRDLSARLIDLMRWAAARAEDPLVAASVAYVRTETFFAARAHTAGLRALEVALDAAPAPGDRPAAAARGALHIRAAVIAARAGAADTAQQHLADAEQLAADLPEGVYGGTAYGMASVRAHQVSVAIALGQDHVGDALAVARRWAPPADMPAERRSGFYIDLARAQLWAGQPDHAVESLAAARRIAPLHTREHPWVRHDIATIRRLLRGPAPEVTAFAEWCRAT